LALHAADNRLKESEIAGAECTVSNTHGLIAAYHSVSVTGPSSSRVVLSRFFFMIAKRKKGKRSVRD